MQRTLITLVTGLILVAGTAFAQSSAMAMSSFSSAPPPSRISGTSGSLIFVQMVHHRWHKRHHVTRPQIPPPHK